jgi:hypothetical protein
VIYPHVGYYTAPALRHVVERAGFTPLDVASSFGGQYLWVDARGSDAPAAGPAAEPAADEVEATLGLATGFAEMHRKTVAGWAEQLAEAAEQGRRVALWGAGTKGATFLNVVPGATGIVAVVDVNPRKRGRFVPGTGHRVCAPEYLVTDRPDVVLVMNNLYEDEIRRTLADLGLDDTTVAVV